jgi:hypothetical protein
MSHKQIRLGGRDFTVKPLTFARLEEVMDCLSDARTAEKPSTRMQANLRIIHAAVAVDHPNLTVEEMRGWVGSVEELYAASEKVLEVAGLIKGADAGEAAAASPSV